MPPQTVRALRSRYGLGKQPESASVHPSSSMPTTITACPFSRTPLISSSSRGASSGRSHGCSPIQSAAWKTTAGSSSMNYSGTIRAPPLPTHILGAFRLPGGAALTPQVVLALTCPASPWSGCFESGVPHSSTSGCCAKTMVPPPHPRRTLAAPSPHPRRTLAESALPPRCTLVVAGNHWLLRSSAILGPASKADVLLEHEGWPTQRDRSEGEQALLASIYNFSEPVRDGSKNMYTWSGRDQVLPLEVALGSVTLHHSKTPDCSPAICSQQPACGLPGGPGLRDVRMATPNPYPNPKPRPRPKPNPNPKPSPNLT